MKPKEIAALMGQMVVVDKQLVRRRSEPRKNEVHWNWEADGLQPRTGWIVGMTRLLTGKRIPGGGGDWDGGYEPPEFQQTGPTTFALLVCFWPNQRPVRVPLSGFRMATLDDPKPHVGAFTWDEASKDQQREIMRDHRRDAKGRWIKGGYKPGLVNA